MTAIDELEGEIGRVWLKDAAEMIADIYLSRFDGSAYKTLECEIGGTLKKWPVVHIKPFQIDILNRLGYLDFIPIPEDKGKEYEEYDELMGIPCLNSKAEKMYERFKSEGYFERR